MEFLTLEEFYRSISNGSPLVPEGISKELGQFNVFDTNELLAQNKGQKGKMPYNRRLYFKISLIAALTSRVYQGR